MVATFLREVREELDSDFQATNMSSAKGLPRGSGVLVGLHATTQRFEDKRSTEKSTVVVERCMVANACSALDFQAGNRASGLMVLAADSMKALHHRRGDR